MAHGFTTEWTTVKFPTLDKPDESLIASLSLSTVAGCRAVYFGPTVETPQTYLLVSCWDSSRLYEAFRTSSAGEKYWGDLKAHYEAEILSTDSIDFGGVIFWPALGLHTEVRTVYFPTSTSPEQRDQIKALEGLTLPYGLGVGGASVARQAPYRKVPIFGWMEERQSFQGQEALACKWINSWNSPEHERYFKDKRRNPLEDGAEEPELILHAWDRELKELGAIGWEECHVDLERV